MTQMFRQLSPAARATLVCDDSAELRPEDAAEVRALWEAEPLRSLSPVGERAAKTRARTRL